MPTMVPVKGSKAAKIREQLLGSPRNEHEVHTKDPRIRQADMQRVLQALMGQMPQQQQQMPPNDMGMMQ